MRCPSRKLARVLLDQIVRKDCYGLRAYLDHPPELVIDIGANVGYFSAACRFLFPNARIVAVEPHPNTHRFLHRNTRGLAVERHMVALSPHPVVMGQGADCGSHYTEAPEPRFGGPPVDTIEGRLFSQMVEEWDLDLTGRYMLKVDCEGGERHMIGDKWAEFALLNACHAALEVHYQCGKWPHAAPREEVDNWVSKLQTRWELRKHQANWRQTRKGGELLLKTRG